MDIASHEGAQVEVRSRSGRVASLSRSPSCAHPFASRMGTEAKMLSHLAKAAPGVIASSDDMWRST